MDLKYYERLFTEYQGHFIDNEGFADYLPLTFGVVVP